MSIKDIGSTALTSVQNSPGYDVAQGAASLQRGRLPLEVSS